MRLLLLCFVSLVVSKPLELAGDDDGVWKNPPLIGGHRPPFYGGLVGGDRPPIHHDSGDDGSVIGGIRPPVNGGEGEEHLIGHHLPPPIPEDQLAGGYRPPHDIGDVPAEGEGQVIGGHRPPINNGDEGELIGGHRPPIHGNGGEGAVAGGYRPPHDIGDVPEEGEGQVIGGHRPPHHNENDGEPFIPHHGIPPPWEQKYPFLKDVSPQARADFHRIITDLRLTKAKMRLAVDEWAQRQGKKIVEEVDAWNEENDRYYSYVRVTLGELIDSIPKAYVDIREVQDNVHITKRQEEEKVRAIFDSLEPRLQDTLLWLISKVDEQGLTSIPDKK